MRNYQVKDRQNNTRVINQEYVDDYYWYWDDEDVDYPDYDDWYIDYEYLPEDIEDEILSNIPYFNIQSNLHIYRHWRLRYKLRSDEKIGKIGRLVDNTSYYSTAKKRDILLDALFSSTVEDPIFSNYCRNWHQLILTQTGQIL